MAAMLVTCLLTLSHLASAQTEVPCPEEQQRARDVTEQEVTWDVGPDISESVCSWRLDTGQPDRVVVVRPTGDPGQTPGCERLEVEYSPGRRERLCGLLWSSDRVVVIYYIPPDSATSIHFNITYYSKRRDDYNNQTTFHVYPRPSIIWISPIQHPQSSVTSPMFEWLLTADDDDNCIELKLLDQRPLRRFFRVYDGNDTTSPELGVCGGGATVTISGTSHSLFVSREPTTTSTADSPATGVWLSFQSTPFCSGDVIRLRATRDLQDIYSPNSSDTDHTNVRCRWLLESADPRHVVSLTAVRSDLESTYKCVKASLAAFEVYSGQLISRWCGQTEPRLVSSQSAMLVVFVSGTSQVTSWFQLQYSARSKVTCDNSLLIAPTTGYRRVFHSPAYPSYYPNRLDCAWRVQVDSAYYGIRLELNSVNLETADDGHCVDYLTIRKGQSSGSSDLARACKAEHAGKRFESMESGLVVTFHSDSNVTNRGFQFTYYSFPKSTKDFGCQARLNVTENPQHLFSAAYPEDYPNNLHCVWVFKTSGPDTVVVLDVVDSEMEISPTNDGDCSADYGVVYDGPDDTYPVLGRWCGLTQPSFRSRGQYLTLVFVTDPARRYRGFELKYYTMKDYRFCPYRRVMTLAATSRIKYFNSPNYPNKYPSNIDCRWLISAPNSSMVVKLDVVESELEKSPVCSFDAVYVYDGKHASGQRLGYFCGTSTPKFRSTQQHIYLEFKTDTSSNERGFKILYRAVRITVHKTSSVVGIVIGGVLGGLAVIAAVATTTVFIVRRRQHVRDPGASPRAPGAGLRSRSGSNIVVNVSRTDNTVFFMSPVIFAHAQSTDHLEMAAPPPPYPGLPNDSFVSDSSHLYDLDDLPPPYSEIDTSLTSTANVSTSPNPQADDTSPARAECAPSRPVIHRERGRHGFGRPNRNSVETSV